MIVHCHSEMTETSSTHCLLRCFTRCFGIDQRRHNNGIKTTLEPTQNGFSHLGEDGKTNGKATIVKVCETNSNGINKPTQLKFVGEKTCCLLQRSTDESPYSYEPVPTEKEGNGGLVIGKIDDLRIDFEDSIDTQSDKALVKTNGHKLIMPNGDVDCKLQLPDTSNQAELGEIERRVTDSQFVVKSNTSILEQDLCDKEDANIPKGSNNSGEDMDDKRGSVPDSVVSAAELSCDAVDTTIDDSLVKHQGDSKVTKNEAVNCNGDAPSSPSQVVPNVQGDERDSKVLQNCQSDAGEHDVPYFKSLVEKETSNLNNLIQKWEEVLSEQPHINEEVGDEIRSVNGQTHLVISERFTQFKSLVEQSEGQANGEQNGTKVITLTDLQGFWDMIFFQVQDVLTKFERLDKIRSNDWNPEILHENDKKPPPKKNTRKPANTRNKRIAKSTNGQSSTTSEEEKARRIAARKRLAEARKRMAAQERTQSSNAGGENFIVQ